MSYREAENRALLIPRGSDLKESHSVQGLDNDDTDHEVDTVVSPWRWWALFLLSALATVQNIAYICISTINDDAKAYYNITNAEVNRLLEIAAIVWGVSVLGFQPFVNKFGIRWGVIISMAFVAAGSICRWLGKDSFNYLVFGQILNGLAGTVITNGPADLAAQWFPVRQRATATGLSYSCMSLGVAIGYLVVPKLAPTTDKIPLLMKYQAYLGIALLVLSFTFPRLPSLPPSQSAATKKIPFFRGFWMLMKNPNFIGLGLVWGAASGVMQTWSNMIDIFLDGKYSDDDIGNLGSVGNLALVAGAISLPALVDALGKQKQMKWFIVVALMLTSVGVFQFTYCNYLQHGKKLSIWIGGIGYIVASFFCGSISPLAIEVGCEIAHPVGEGTAGAFFNTMFMIVNIGATEVGNYMQGREVTANVGATIVFAVCMFAMMPIQSSNSRLLLDKKQN
eukprot:m.100782 g.100782  ORF g.100782 m.100782 type:complete len:451 (+) comp27273_c0_seq2:349-1701(+)